MIPILLLLQHAGASPSAADARRKDAPVWPLDDHDPSAAPRLVNSSGAFVYADPAAENPAVDDRTFTKPKEVTMFEGQPQAELDVLLKSDSEFRQLYHRHRELDKQVLDAELGVLPLDDNTLARMKKEKLHAKDRLTQMYDARRSAH